MSGEVRDRGRHRPNRASKRPKWQQQRQQRWRRPRPGRLPPAIFAFAEAVRAEYDPCTLNGSLRKCSEITTLRRFRGLNDAAAGQRGSGERSCEQDRSRS